MYILLGSVALLLLSACSSSTDDEATQATPSLTPSCTLTQVGLHASDQAVVNISCKDATFSNSDDLAATLTVNANTFRMYFSDQAGVIDENLTITSLSEDATTEVALQIYLVDADPISSVIDLITIAVANIAPTVDAGVDQSVSVYASASIAATANDVDGVVVSVVWSEGTSILSNTLSFDYTPTTVATHTLSVTVTDDEGATVSDTMSVTANAAPGNQPPEWTQASYDTGLTITDANDDPKVILDLASVSSDPEGDTITYSIINIIVPAGENPDYWTNSLYVENDTLKVHNLMTNDPNISGTIIVTVKAEATGGSNNTDISFTFDDVQ